MESSSKPLSLHRFLLINKDFSCLWFASVISMMGDWFNQTALLGLVLEKTGSSLSASFLLLASILPMTLLAPIAGPIADKFSRKKILFVSNIIAAIVALLFVFIQHPNQIWMVYPFTILLVTVVSFGGPASQAAIPNLVGKDGMLSAIALQSAAFGSMLAIGSGLGGIVAATFGRNTCFIVNAVSFLIAALLILKIKTPLDSNEKNSDTVRHPIQLAKDFKDGINYILSNRSLRVQILVKCGWGLGAGVLLFLAVLPIQVWKAGDLGIGIIYAARGIGAIFGPFIARRIAGESSSRMYNVIVVALLANGVFYLAYSLSPNLWTGAIFTVLAHFGGSAAWVFSTVLIQSGLPDHLQGRVLSIDMALITATMTISSLLSGWAATIYSPRIVAATDSIIIIGFALTWYFLTRPLLKTSTQF